MAELYTLGRRKEDGTEIIEGYAYGEEWVSQALLMNDIKFDTPEEAKAWWEKNYGGGKEERDGKWIVHDDEIFGLTYECSECHAEGMVKGNFCYNCGADMRDVPDTNVGKILYEKGEEQ